ncbi:hypothetical protein BYT27DRAFT_7160389 [Phlegmacium glaucopus]|nr:hypothetical protein BYT27DRAFT_7160389 [Phlegmacium glaucopus]
MISTITVYSHRMDQPQDKRFSTNANSAGAPLPLIPRRTSSTTSLSSKPPITSSVSLLKLSSSDSPSTSNLSSISRTTSPRDVSDSSSLSSSPSDGIRPTIHTKRVRGVRVLGPPELSTSTPTLKAAYVVQNTDHNIINDATRPTLSRPMIYTPGMSLRDNLKPRNVSNSFHLRPAESSAQGAKSAFSEFPKGRLVRKKSGQLVKSSLKPSKSATRNTLSIVTIPQSSKSEPTTPTNKAVHFDAKLEHVKLFLAEQKPLAVSRDGSPTDDTSGTDSDFPRFIYGEGDDTRSRTKLLMQLCNMPSTINPNLDVALENLSLKPDGTSILGRVRVRNIAFAKWVAIRFTFDSWQTTSEVTGRYVESISSEFDRFSFTIRLNDLLARIEGKTLVVAIRYSVAGQDIWDNNNGQNYLATFTKAKTDETRSPISLSDEEASTNMADLRSKLEKVSQSDDRTGPAFLAQYFQRQPVSADPDVTYFRTSTSFASRYDFTASLKSSWDPSMSPPSHSRNQSFPFTGSRTSPSSIPWPQKGSADIYSPKCSPVHGKPNKGSPRDICDHAFMPVHRQQMEVADGIHNIQPYTPRSHRRGYFDFSRANGPHSSPAALRQTPPGTPTSSVQKLLRYRPPFNGDNFIADLGGDSELSTPSLFTPSSSRSSTPSPTETVMNPLVCEENDENLSPDTHYRQFIDKFCFFTGQGPFLDESRVDLLPRAHSASDIEEFLSGVSPRVPFTTTMGSSPNNMASTTISTSFSVSPTRSSSLDDLMLNRSGSLTPTVSRLALMSVPASIAISASVSCKIGI